MSQSGANELEKALTSSLSIPKNHLTLGLTNLIHSNKSLLSLITHRRLPSMGWSDIQIQSLLFTLSTLDTNHESSLETLSNNEEFTGRWVGVGEREGRVYSNLVSQRHWGISHGIGRSGDVTEPQPKAVGSSILAQLTKWLVLDAMRRGCGLKGDKAGDPVKFGLVLPLCTGMTMSLVLSSLRDSSKTGDDHDNGKGSHIERDIVLWSRIDQKSCFKAVLSAGLKCVVVPTRMEGDEVVTDLNAMEECMEQYKDRVLAVISTTSCFAPRVPDKIDEIGKLCKSRDVAHVINNAYGLQCQTTCKLINRACVIGRVDAIICSTDKNFLVPVGGAIVTSPSEAIAKSLGKIYAGRASSSPIMDLFVTLLSMGLNGYSSLLQKRSLLSIQFQQKFEEIALKYNEKILKCPRNTISFGITLDTLGAPMNCDNKKSSTEECNDINEKKKRAKMTSQFGSMLFTRCVSGTRVVAMNEKKVICGQEFIGFGSSTHNFPHSYLTAACAIGLTKVEMEEFFVRLDKCFKDFWSKRKKNATKGGPASE